MQLKTFSALALLLTAAPLYAQTDTPQNSAPQSHLEQLLAARPLLKQTLSLSEAVTIALRESPVVRGAVEETKAALGQLNAARAEKRPTLSANTFLSGGSISNIVESPSATSGGMIMNLPRGSYFDQNLMLMAPLYTGGRLNTLVTQARALHDASQADLESQRQEIALLVRTAYHEIQARRALVEVQQARLRENQEQLRLDRVRADEGKIPPFYVQRSEAEVAAAQQEIVNTTRDVELSLLQLKTVMGVHPASQIEVGGALEYQPSAALFAQLTGTSPDVAAPISNSQMEVASAASVLPPELSALLFLAERTRPELRAASFRVTGAKAEATAVGQAYRPQVNAFMMGDVFKSRGQSSTAGTTFGVAASIPIFTGGRKSAAQQIAQAQSRVQQQARERVLLEVAQSVNAAFLNLRAAEQNITTVQTALVAAREDYRVARVRYEAGKSIPVEVLDALAARTRAASNQVQALYEWNVARDQLLRAVGVIALNAGNAEDGAPLVSLPDPVPVTVPKQ